MVAADYLLVVARKYLQLLFVNYGCSAQYCYLALMYVTNLSRSLFASVPSCHYLCYFCKLSKPTIQWACAAVSLGLVSKWTVFARIMKAIKHNLHTRSVLRSALSVKPPANPLFMNDHKIWERAKTPWHVPGRDLPLKKRYPKRNWTEKTPGNS